MRPKGRACELPTDQTILASKGAEFTAPCGNQNIHDRDFLKYIGVLERSTGRHSGTHRGSVRIQGAGTLLSGENGPSTGNDRTYGSNEW
ncbi:hypothetical protein MRX96_001220 [Rhipicephalus microplus]